MLTQALQLAHGARHAALRHTGTLGALDAMAKAGLIPEQVCRELDHAYVFLRAAEHRRQLGLGGRRCGDAGGAVEGACTGNLRHHW